MVIWLDILPQWMILSSQVIKYLGYWQTKSCSESMTIYCNCFFQNDKFEMFTVKAVNSNNHSSASFKAAVTATGIILFHQLLSVVNVSAFTTRRRTKETKNVVIIRHHRRRRRIANWIQPKISATTQFRDLLTVLSQAVAKKVIIIRRIWRTAI